MTPAHLEHAVTPMPSMKLGPLLESKLQALIPDLQDNSIEAIRRDQRGTFYIQIQESSWSKVDAYLQSQYQPALHLGMWGDWALSPVLPSPLAGYTPVVIHNLATDITLEALMAEIPARNNHLLGVTPEDQGVHFKDPQRLKRKDTLTSQWVESRAVRLWVSHPLGERLIAVGALNLFFSYHPVQRYKSPPLTCFNCMKKGHQTQFCRSLPFCRHCKEQHPSHQCPTRPENQMREDPPPPPPTSSIPAAPPGSSHVDMQQPPKRKQNPAAPTVATRKRQQQPTSAGGAIVLYRGGDFSLAGRPASRASSDEDALASPTAVPSAEQPPAPPSDAHAGTPTQEAPEAPVVP